MTIEVKLDNKRLLELIAQSPTKADQAVRATAFYVEALAKNASPYMTGANRASIYTKTSAGANGTPGDAGDILPNANIGEAYVGPSMEYSARLEFGFVGVDALGRSYNQAPQPYLSPAAAQAPAYLERILTTYFK